MIQNELDITPSPRLLQVLGDIPLAPWQCLAEFIDNSLDEMSKTSQLAEPSKLKILINIERSATGSTELVITDNGQGMSESALSTALRAGATSKARYGTLGLFGMGFNIATARLGTQTTVTTARSEDHDELSATIDFADLQRRERFQVPLRRTPKTKISGHGTEVRVKLKRDSADYFSSKKHLDILRNQLGDVYSYLLRDLVPGISYAHYSAAVPAEIYLAGQIVKPKLPCVWSDSRSVLSYGHAVPTVQYIDVQLSAATACLMCGYWERGNGPEQCSECGSTALEERARRIWGWIGIQRYIDASHFGLDFLRFGRKILKQDKTIFVYEDPDTLQSDLEYPIEMPANRGRIIGEIHLDHVPVTYQKNDFDRQSKDWQKAIEQIRGDGPLKPRNSQLVNNSPLARLYSAYRRNDPGIRYLTPGDGRQALHNKAREWATFFDKGVQRYQDDSEWYLAVQRHQEIVDGGTSRPAVSPSAGATRGLQSEASADDALARTLLRDNESGAASVSPTMVRDAPTRTRADILDDLMAFATERADLSGDFTLPNGGGTWSLSVYEVSREFPSELNEAGPALIRTMTGTAIQVVLSSIHPVFVEYGRDLRDVALIEAAEAIKSLSNCPDRTSVIYSSFVQLIPDLCVNSSAIEEQSRSILSRISNMVYDLLQADANDYWQSLTTSQKQSIEERAALKFPNLPFEEIVDDGRFVLFATGSALSAIVRYDPVRFFENRVFTALIQRRPDSAKHRIVAKVTNALEALSEFLDDPANREPEELELVRLQIELLNKQLRSETNL